MTRGLSTGDPWTRRGRPVAVQGRLPPPGDIGTPAVAVSCVQHRAPPRGQPHISCHPRQELGEHDKIRNEGSSGDPAAHPLPPHRHRANAPNPDIPRPAACLVRAVRSPGRTDTAPSAPGVPPRLAEPSPHRGTGRLTRSWVRPSSDPGYVPVSRTDRPPAQNPITGQKHRRSHDPTPKNTYRRQGPNVSALIAERKRHHCAGSNSKIGPHGSLPSRIRTMNSSEVDTSTQLPVPQRELFRHPVCVDGLSPNVPP